MSTPSDIPHSPGRWLRLLLLDGSPGATTLLILATHHALNRVDAVLIPDTGWYPAHTYAHLDRLAHIATTAGIETVWVDAGADIAAHSRLGSGPGPLPLHTHSPNGAISQLPNGCAARQHAALATATRHLLHDPPPTAGFRNAGADHLLGLTAEHAHLAQPARSCHRRNLYPLVRLGWTSPDCRAHLAHHDLAFLPDMACIACPNRTNVTWAELRATQPQAWQEAIAADAALRHHPDWPPSGMPPGTTGYLHPARQPLAEVNLDAAPTTASPACLAQACRGIPTGAGQLGGGR